MGVTAGPERLHAVDARAVLLTYGLPCAALGSEPVGHRSDEPPAQRRLGAGLRQRIRPAGVMMAAVAPWGDAAGLFRRKRALEPAPVQAMR